ncbi:long-chain fatty acid--CoA ligase [Nocardia sp. NBC_00565]|uniref:acyl-CoA synthetase n=1 Tax=Nocardia sp. NBC_00565 TaxID=2975993 RepID=UPI002E7FC715|nr:long-chain fatty acid--CoA ligase [Nocardia sp. NBC_00565]WUC00152.1 long-chain fatty acid--CoA ligase [Nocardia sp. NBC_00565]
MNAYLTQGLHRAVQRDPQAIATICGDQVRTFAEHADRVARIAGALHELGVAPDDRVAVLANNSDRYIELLLAVAWADAVMVPLNTRWSPAEIDHAIRDCRPVVLFTDDALAATAAQLSPHGVVTVQMGDTMTNAPHLERLLAHADPIPDARRGGASPAGIFYTGGTTGLPKGVVLSHTNVLTSALGSASTGWFYGPQDRVLHVAPLFHVAAFTSWVLGWVAGCSHVILPGFTPDAVLDAVQRHRVTATSLVPTMIGRLFADPGLTARDVTSLQRIIYGASAMPEATVRRALATLPGVEFVQAYGMTELSPVATILGPAEHVPELLRSAGRAAPHAEVRIAGPDDDDLPTGAIGEVVVRGAQVMLGYWNRPEETERALAGGWMHTGDAGYLDADGYLFVVDRIKDMIITGGENVYSAEVENALASHPAVESCAVIGLPDPDWGERVHAVVVAVAPVTEQELRDHVHTLIAGYKTPRSVEFVDALPISGAGKILKNELRKTRTTSVG